MKNIILFIFTSVYSFTHSQVTIPTSHCPRIGDTFVFAVDTTLYSPKPISGGMYDFSDLKLHDTTTYYYTANDSLVSQPMSNLKLRIDTNEATATYFNKSNNDIFVIALSSLPTQLPIPVAIPKLKGSLKFFSFPLTSTTNITTTDKIDITVPASFIPPQFNIDSLLGNIFPGATVTIDSLLLSLNLELNLKVDGFGKINTPIDNNLDVLKLIRKISITPKIYMNGSTKLGSITVPVTNFDITSMLLGAVPFNIPDIITHSYYSPSFRQEIVNSTVDSNGKYTSVNYRYRTKNGPNVSSISAFNQSNIDIQLIQNKIIVTGLKTSEDYFISLTDLTGRNLLHQPITHFQNSIDWIPISNPFIINIFSNNFLFSKKYKLNN